MQHYLRPFSLTLLLAMLGVNAVVAQTEDTAIINQLLREGKELVHADKSKSIAKINKALLLSKNADYARGQAMAYQYLGRIAIDTANYMAGIDAQNKALALLENLEGEELALAASYNFKGIASENTGNYKDAVNFYLKAITLFEMVGDSTGMTNVYNNIALVYNAQENYKRADYYYQKAFDLATAIADEFLLITTRNNMGLSLMQQQKYAEAEAHFKATLAFDLKDGSPEYIGGSYNNLGGCKLKTGHYKEALSLLIQAEKFKRISGDKYGLTISLINKSQALAGLKQFENAIAPLLEALEIATNNQANQHLSEIYLDLSAIEDSLQNHKASLNYYRLHHQVLDSLKLGEQKLAIEKLQTAYNVKKKDLEISNQQIQLDKQQLKLKWYLTALSLISLSLLLLLWSVYRIRSLNKVLKQNEDALRINNEALNKSNENLANARDLAENSSRAKSNFLSNVSHEIITPMNVIMGLSQLLEDEALSDKARQNLRFIQQSSQHLLHIINDILDLSKIEAGKISFDDVRFNLPDLFKQLHLTMETLKGDKPIEIKTIISPEIPDYLRGDHTRLHQILSNLITNALKFTEKGSVSLEVNVLEINNELYKLGFTVSDTGIGIQPDRIDKIFDSFTQAEEDHSRKYGGTGLGLTITKRLIELQGGNIHLKSLPGEGSVFEFELSYASDSPGILLPDRKKPKNEHDFSRLRILLVEDNRLNINLATQLFKKWKAVYVIAENGHEALDQLKKFDFDLILLDLHMPGLNGFETFNAIRKSEIKTPVVALTADAFEDTREKVYKMGFYEMLIKPYRAEDLANIILSATQHNA